MMSTPLPSTSRTFSTRAVSFAIEVGTLAWAEENVESDIHATLDLEFLRKSLDRSEITHLG